MKAGAWALLLGLCALSGCSADSRKPPHKQLARVARWLVHESTYGVLTTLSTDPATLGMPFGNPQSIVDGPYVSVNTPDTPCPCLNESILRVHCLLAHPLSGPT
jgi:hypothetical protein